MDKIIAACGLDCAACPAFIASRTNDQALRQKTAIEWTAAFGFAFTPDMIDCHGCHAVDGVQIGHCSECAIRACVLGRGHKNCAACSRMESCGKNRELFAHAPEALANLKDQGR